MSCAETTEPIDLPFGLCTLVSRRKHEFNRVRQMAPVCTISIIFARWRQCTQRYSAVSCAKMAEPISVPTWIGTLAPPGEYDWTVHLRPRCGLMSNYLDHLLLYACTLVYEVVENTSTRHRNGIPCVVVEKIMTRWREDGGIVVEKICNVDELSIKILAIYLQQ